MHGQFSAFELTAKESYTSAARDLLITYADPAIIPDSVTGGRSLKPLRAGNDCFHQKRSYKLRQLHRFDRQLTARSGHSNRYEYDVVNGCFRPKAVAGNRFARHSLTVHSSPVRPAIQRQAISRLMSKPCDPLVITTSPSPSTGAT